MGKARILFKQALKAKTLPEYLDFMKQIEEIFKKGAEKDREEASDVLKEPRLFKKNQELQEKEKKEKISPHFYLSSMPEEVPSSKTSILSSIKLYEDIHKKTKGHPTAKKFQEKIKELKKKLEEAK